MKKWKLSFHGPSKYLLNYPRTGVDADEYVWGNSSFSLQSAIDMGAPLNEALLDIQNNWFMLCECHIQIAVGCAIQTNGKSLFTLKPMFWTLCLSPFDIKNNIWQLMIIFAGMTTVCCKAVDHRFSLFKKILKSELSLKWNVLNKQN